jgi:dipeptidyl aminopeptidase/acylaminoacyl peptidase
MIRVTVTVLWLLITVAAAGAQPAAVSPFPGGLSGTIAFQSDARSASNPNGRVRLYTINLANGAIAALGTGGDWDDEQPRWSPDGRRVAFRRLKRRATYQSRRQRSRSHVGARW